jgi:hypothetical protein
MRTFFVIVMKQLISVPLLCVATFTLNIHAQDTFQKLEQNVLSVDENPVDSAATTSGKVGLNLSQTALANWAGGGQSSVAFTGLFNLKNDTEHGKVSHGYQIDGALGQQIQGGEWIKTDDRFSMSARYSVQTKTDLRLAALLDFRTQFLPGYAMVDGAPDKAQVISEFLSPGYAILALGLTPPEAENFKFFIAPLTYKLTVVRNEELAAAGTFGVEPGENIRSEIGGYMRFWFTAHIAEGVDWESQLDLFSNYLNQPGNIDINFSGLLSLKVNDWLATTISSQVIYDHDVTLEKEAATTEIIDGVLVEIPALLGPGTQFKEVLSIGISMAF